MNTVFRIHDGEPMDAAQLLAEYGEDSSFFFASPRQTLLGQGIDEILPTADLTARDEALLERIETLFERRRSPAMPNPILAGAIPFDDSAPVRLFMPERVSRAGPIRLSQGEPDPHAPVSRTGECSIRMVPEPAGYVRGVEQALERIARKELHKVVLSRSLELSFPMSVDLRRLLQDLAHHNHYGYTYAVDLAASATLPDDTLLPLPNTRSHRLIGASPELLVRRHGPEVVANPLAGSAPRSGDPQVDRERAEALFASDKDRREHAVVVEAVARALQPYCRRLEVPPVPSIVLTDSMMHLSTRVNGTLSSPQTNALALARALHPTPAVCGDPPACAHAAIRSIEPFERRYFAGMVGWVDAKGDGEWAVTIRCAEAEGCRLRLYAGAGVVAGSTAEQELAETSAKFRTLLNAMGLDALPEVHP